MVAVTVLGSAAGFGYACAIVLAATFVRASVAKASHPAETASGFAALGVPAAAALAWVVPVVELVLAVLLLAVPRIGGAAALVTLAAFSAFLSRALGAGVTAGCNCFGQTRSEPISRIDLVRNCLLALLAAAALSATRPTTPGLVSGACLVAAVAGGAALLRAARSRRTRAGPPH